MIRASEVVEGLARPRGRFPHYRRAGDLIFVSGTSSRRADDSFVGVETDPAGGVALDIAGQTRAVIENIGHVLAAADARLDQVVEVTAFLADMADFDAYNAIYAEYFDEDGPARTTVAVRALPHPHLLIEMRAVAYAPAAAGRGS